MGTGPGVIRMTTLVRIFALVAVLGLAGPVRAEPGTYTTLDAAQVREMVAKGVTVVDVRRSDEWRDTGVIEGAARITAFDARGRFDPDFPAAFSAAVAPDEEVVIICRSGNRSRVVSELLTGRAGYSRVYNAGGGMRSWIAGGNPVAACPEC